MKKKTLAVYALIGALTTGTSLTSCIDNDESLSVTQLREAKAQQLKAQAEAELIRSNAEAALLNAEAELNRLKAEAQKLENEANKAKYEAEIEAVRAKAELELIKAQKKIQELQHEMDNAAFEQYNKLFKEYNRALRKLFELKNQCLGTKTLIAKTEAEVISAKAAILEERMKLESELAQDEIMLALLKDPQYQSIDNKAMKEKIQKEEVQLQLDKQKFESSSTNLDFLAALDKFEEAQNYYDEVSYMADDLNDLSSENNMPDIVIRSFDQHIEINSLLVLPIMRIRMTLLTLLEQIKYIHIPVYKYRINEAAKIAMYNQLDQKIEKKTQSLGTPNDDASKNTAYGKLALC